MGADFLLVATPLPHDASGDVIPFDDAWPRLETRMAEFNQLGFDSNAIEVYADLFDDDDGGHASYLSTLTLNNIGFYPPMRPETLTMLTAAVKADIVELCGSLQSREVAVFRPSGVLAGGGTDPVCVWTGGMSWGDAPTDIFDVCHRVNVFGITFDPLE